MNDAMTYNQLMRRWEARGKELRTLKEEVAQLEEENATLKRENKIRKAWTEELSAVNLKWAKIISKHNFLLADTQEQT